MAQDLFNVVVLRAGLSAAVLGVLETAWRARGGSFDTILLEEGILDEVALQPLLEERWQLKNRMAPWIQPSREALRLMTAQQARRYQLVPLALAGRVLEVLTADPGDVSALDELAFITGMRVSANVGSHPRVARELHVAYGLELEPRLAMALAPHSPAPLAAEPVPLSASVPEPMPHELSGPPLVTLDGEALRTAAAEAIAEATQPRIVVAPTLPTPPPAGERSRPARSSGEYSITRGSREEVSLPPSVGSGIERRRPTVPPVPGEPQPPTPMPSEELRGHLAGLPPQKQRPLDDPARPDLTPSSTGPNPFAPRARRVTRASIPVPVPAPRGEPAAPTPTTDPRAQTLLAIDPPPLPQPPPAQPRGLASDFEYRDTELAHPQHEAAGLEDNDLGRRVRALTRAAELPPMLFADLRALLPRLALFCAIADDALWGWHAVGTGAITGVTFRPEPEGLLGHTLRSGEVYAGAPPLAALDEAVVVRLGNAPGHLLLWPVLARGRVAWILWGEAEHALGLAAAQDRLRGAVAALSALATKAS
jgi:hypothetical protein